MRIVVLCAFVAATLFTANTAEARHRRRCCYTGYNYGYNWGCNSCGQTACNSFVPAAPCQGACGVATSVQAACAPAQPATYTSAYPPSDPNAINTAPPPPVQNGNPPAPQPINN